MARWPPDCRGGLVSDGSTLAYTLAWADGRRAGTYYAGSPAATGACTAADPPGEDALTFAHAVYALAGLRSDGSLPTP